MQTVRLKVSTGGFCDKGLRFNTFSVCWFFQMLMNAKKNWLVNAQSAIAKIPGVVMTAPAMEIYYICENMIRASVSIRICINFVIVWQNLYFTSTLSFHSVNVQVVYFEYIASIIYRLWKVFAVNWVRSEQPCNFTDTWQICPVSVQFQLLIKSDILHRKEIIIIIELVKL